MKNPIVYLLCVGQDYAAAVRFADGLRERKIDCRAIDVQAVGSLTRLVPEHKLVLFCASPWAFGDDMVSQLENMAPQNLKRLRIFAAAIIAVPKRLRDISVINAALLGMDRGTRDLLRFILDPEGIDLICVPSQMVKVTGVSWWWDDELIVADEYFGHVIRIRKEHQTSLLLVGLDEPYHVHLDRRILIVSDLGANEVLIGRMVLGALTDVIAIPAAADKRFRRPHGVFQGGGWSLIADSDNHRILWKRRHMSDTSEQWKVVELPGDDTFRFPNGVCADENQIWVADTWKRRVIRLRPHKSESPVVIPLHGPRTPYPVTVLSQDRYLLVSDEANRAVRVFRIFGRGRPAKLIVENLLPDVVDSPLGLSVNRVGRLAIADRSRGVIWTAKLSDLIRARRRVER